MFYLQAVALDDSDVTVWYHLGVVTLKTFDLCLARHSFEEVCVVHICKTEVPNSPKCSTVSSAMYIYFGCEMYCF